MEVTDPASLIEAGESENVEFKEDWRDQSCLEELAGLANTEGGTLLVGVSDDGSVAGWSGGDLDVLADKISNTLRVHPSGLRTEEIRGESILLVSIPKAQRPVSYRGRYFHRVGATTREIPPDELTQFLTRRSGQTWDVLSSGKSMEAISREKLERFVEQSEERLPVAKSNEPTEDLLDKLDLLANDGVPSRAALLLFGKKPQSLTFSAHVRMGRFKTETMILDDRSIKGTLFDQLDEVMRQFRQYLEVRYDIPEESEGREGIELAERKEIWTYPLPALREAVVNALIHRDYTELGNIEIRVFDDHISIGSPGGLPEGITVEELRQPQHASIQRNPRIAQTFYYAGLVERWGTGTTRIKEACRNHGLPAPEFDATTGRFAVTFEQDPYSEERLQEIGLNERQILAFRYAREHGRIDNKRLTELTDVSKRTASRDLSDLADKGLLEKFGATGKGTYYEATQ